jgi:hypothetical protein
VILDVALCRYGYGVTHAARVPEQSVRVSGVWGAPCELIDPPIVARCGATLRSVAIRMETPVDCRACRAILNSERAA